MEKTCSVVPIFNEETAARIHFTNDVIDSMNDVMLTHIGSNKFIFHKKNQIANGFINLNNKCIFYDEKNKKCMINLEDKCSDLRLYYNDIENVRNYPIQLRKLTHVKYNDVREYALISIVVYYINNVAKNDDKIIVNSKYELVFTKDKTINSVRIDILEPVDKNNKVLKYICELHNILYKRIVFIDNMPFVVESANKVLRGTQMKQCEDVEKTRNELYYLFAALLYLKYKNEFKNKKQKFKDVKISTNITTFDLFRYFFPDLSNKSMAKILNDERVKCFNHNVDITYKRLISQLK